MFNLINVFYKILVRQIFQNKIVISERVRSIKINNDMRSFWVIHRRWFPKGCDWKVLKQLTSSVAIQLSTCSYFLWNQIPCNIIYLIWYLCALWLWECGILTYDEVHLLYFPLSPTSVYKGPVIYPQEANLQQFTEVFLTALTQSSNVSKIT